MKRPPATIALVPTLRAFDLRFADLQLEADFVAEMIPSRRKVGQVNFLMLSVAAALLWLGMTVSGSTWTPQMTVALLGLGSMGVAGWAQFRWGASRWFDLANSASVLAGCGIVIALVASLGPAFGLAFTIVSLIAIFLSGTAPFHFAVANALGGAAFYLLVVPRVFGYSGATTLTHAVAVLLALTAGAQRGRLYTRILREGWFHQRLSDRLLENVLPASIVPRLKAGETSIADRHASATVLFADLAGFTALSSQLAPDVLVALLREVFDRFDELSAKAGVEKIKTIGDAYMAAGGIADGRADHIDRMAQLALEMRDAFAVLPSTRQHALSVRIGLHTGPVVAGVLGTRRLAYDLWGDVVNIASRMESHGEAGRIHVSEAFAAQVGAAFSVEPRGRIQVKGKGELTTFWLERRC